MSAKEIMSTTSSKDVFPARLITPVALFSICSQSLWSFFEPSSQTCRPISKQYFATSAKYEIGHFFAGPNSAPGARAIAPVVERFYFDTNLDRFSES